MEWLGPVLTALIGRLDPVMLVMIILLGGCGYYHVIWRREDREDKAKLLDAFNKNTEALASLKNIISAATGKPLV
jgi:hypothetical protein